MNFEQTLSKISSRFVAPIDINEAINMTLRDMGLLSRASRAYLFLFSDDKKFSSNTHEWCAKGVSSQISDLQDLPIDSIPWWYQRIKSRNIIHIQDLSELPDRASNEKKLLQKQDIKTLIAYPILVKGEAIGFIGFDNIKNTDSW